MTGRACEMDERTLKIKENEREGNVWGYAVCFGTAITFIAGIGHVNSFGLIFNDFMIDTQSTAKSLTTAHGVFAIMLALGGILLNILAKSISLRLGGLIGATFFTLGSFTTIPISNLNQLPITFGVLQGIGFGMMVPVSYSTINHYFVKRRTTVMSVIKALQGLVMIWYPQVLKQIVYHYGFRGTLLIISSISLHTIPGMLVMNKLNRKKTASNVENGASHHENDDLLRVKEEANAVIDKTAVIKKRSFRLKLIEILNLKSLRDPVYRNICIGLGFVNFSDLIFFMLQPMLLFQYGYDTSQVALCISICTGADVASRCSLVFISSITHINTRVLYFTATILTFVFRIVMLQIRDFSLVASVTALLGVLRAWLHVASPLVISDHVSHQDFSGAYALFMLCAGVINVVFSPIIGLMKDLYQDYDPAFYVLAICCLPCLVTWSVEYFCRTEAIESH